LQTSDLVDKIEHDLILDPVRETAEPTRTLDLDEAFFGHGLGIAFLIAHPGLVEG
jgi:hypothetical protein